MTNFANIIDEIQDERLHLCFGVVGMSLFPYFVQGLVGEYGQLHNLVRRFNCLRNLLIGALAFLLVLFGSPVVNAVKSGQILEIVKDYVA
jgi:hypothetical protein